MSKENKIISQIVLVIVFSCVFQWPVLYGLFKMSFFSCNSVSILKSPSPDHHTNTETTPSPLIKSEDIRTVVISPPRKDDPLKLSIQSADIQTLTISPPQKDNNLKPSIQSADIQTVAIDSPPPKDDPLKPKQQALHPHGYAHYPFVQFSAYRDSDRAFFVIGITSVVARSFDQPVQQCEWKSSQNGLQPSPPTLTAKARMIYVYYDQLPRLYVVAMVDCTFEHEVGIENEGGLLFITVSVGPNVGDTEKRLALEEKKGAASDLLRKRENPPALKIAYCGPPMHGSIRADWILHWLVYHHYLWKGRAHFFFYNVGGLGDEHRRVLGPFLRGGYLTIIDALDERKFPSWYHNQLLFINDCLHMTRYLSSWTFFHDLDEFLFVPQPRSLDQLLKKHKRKTFLTFGSIRSVTSLCADPPAAPSDWLVQRFLWMKKQPHCLSNQNPWVCLQGPGARKYAVNPRKVFATAVHNTALPPEGGIDLNATIAWMYHYHGVLSAEANLCEKKLNASLSLDQLQHEFPEITDYNTDHSISEEVAKARNFYARSMKML